MDVLGIQDVMK